MKYIVLEVTDLSANGSTHKREIPVVFPEFLVHANMAQAVTRMLRAEKPDGRLRQVRPVSAGQVSSVSFEGGCHGKSTTLGLSSRGDQDDRLIKGMDYFHGIVD